MKKKILLVVMLLFCVFVLATGCSLNGPEISLGSWDENTYTNEFLGLTYVKPEEWTRYSDEEIKKLMEIGTELTDASEISKKLAELTSVTYMMTSSSTGTNVIVMSENVFGEMTAKEYANHVKGLLEKQETLSYTVDNPETEKIDGKEFITMKVKVDTVEQRYYVYSVDDYMVSIVISLTPGNEAKSVIEQFEFN